MAYRGLTWSGFLLRLLMAAILVFSTYNPSGTSFYHWVARSPLNFEPSMALVGIVLLIGWSIFLRATGRSLGAFGLLLAAAFFGALLWLMIDKELIPTDSIEAISYIVLAILAWILAIGVSWSHIRRRLTGQVDVDEVDEDV